MMLKPFKSLGRDLYFEERCNCPNPDYKDSEIAHIMKSYVRLTGYADDNFMERVNARPQTSECRHCGRRFKYQWRWDGVLFAWED